MINIIAFLIALGISLIHIIGLQPISRILEYMLILRGVHLDTVQMNLV